MGRRLRALFHSIPTDATDCWDLCCDHGAVGRAVLEAYPHCRVIFNDIHPDIMRALDDKLTQLDSINYQLIVCPAENIELSPSARPVIVLAGVGDQQCIKILSSLFAQPACRNATFVVSPATKTYYVRKFLIESNVYLCHEETVTENKRTYEILTIELTPRYGSDLMESTLGFRFGQCWKLKSKDDLEHINKLVHFYQSQLRNPHSSEAEEIVYGYQKLLKKMQRRP